MKVKLSTIAFVAFLVTTLFASNPLRAQSWGLEIGVGHHMQKDTFQAPCGCKFDGGTGNGFTGAITADFISFLGIHVGMKVGVDFKNFTSEHIWPGSGWALMSDGSVENLAKLGTLDHGEIATTYLNLTPYARMNLFGTPAFVEVGAGISKLISSHFFQFREHVSGTTVGGQSVSNIRYLSGATDTTLEDGPFSNISSMRYSALLSAGYEFTMMGMIVAPMITYDIPLANVHTFDHTVDQVTETHPSDWNIQSLYGSVAIRFGL